MSATPDSVMLGALFLVSAVPGSGLAQENQNIPLKEDVAEIEGKVPEGWKVRTIESQSATLGPFKLPDGRDVYITTPVFVLEPGDPDIARNALAMDSASGLGADEPIDELLTESLQVLDKSTERFRQMLVQLVALRGSIKFGSEGSSMKTGTYLQTKNGAITVPVGSEEAKDSHDDQTHVISTPQENLNNSPQNDPLKAATRLGVTQIAPRSPAPNPAKGEPTPAVVRKSRESNQRRDKSSSLGDKKKKDLEELPPEPEKKGLFWWLKKKKGSQQGTTEEDKTDKGKSGEKPKDDRSQSAGSKG